MYYSSLNNRIRKARRNTYAGGNLVRIAELIAQGAYYDELTDEEKNTYCAYQGIERKPLEAMSNYFAGSLHFQLERKAKPPGEADLEERVREVEAIMQTLVEEYNSPKARAERERNYQELLKIGEQRKAACERGEDMSKYPLPWENKPGNNIERKDGTEK